MYEIKDEIKLLKVNSIYFIKKVFNIFKNFYKKKINLTLQ